jgi:hypothetical protein
MKNQVKKEGRYELFLTTGKNEILSLDQSSWFAVAKGQRGDIIVRSSSDHEKEKTLNEGQYYLVLFNEDPDFRDMPHLMLEESSGKFREWILPKNLPSDSQPQVKLIKTNYTVSETKLRYHMKNKRTSTRARKELESKSRSSLYKLAKNKNIKGRSKMDKNELLKALSD